MSTLNVDMIREIQNDHPGIPEPFLNENKPLLSRRTAGMHFFPPESANLVSLARHFTVLLRLRPEISSPHIS